ncbi:Leucine rich repeat-containing protein 1 [Elsinoe fawcettii]|nr:Leucine rich repeat-containing protein 1 [Elsinoe fawcettii]
MPGATQPWLADLPDEWVPQPAVATRPSARSDSVSSVASQKEQVLGNAASNSIRRGLSQLGQNEQNARTASGSVRRCDAIGTVKSVDSVVRYDTVERQTSPNKKDTTLTWRKRLVDGDLGYGDQTDLFGPSSLENIFSPTKPPNSAAKTPSRLQKFSVPPSSPPTLPPSMFKKQDNDFSFGKVSDRSWMSEAENLERHQSPELGLDDKSQVSVDTGSAKVSMRSDRSETVDRKVSGQTDAGNETFSPVIMGKHIMDGQVIYKPADAESVQAYHNSSVATSRTAVPATGGYDNHAQDLSDDVLENSIPLIESSLMPDNVIEATPPMARLGSFVNTKRGGLSNCGSFKTKPLSPSAPDSRKPSVIMQSVEIQDFTSEQWQQQDTVSTTPQTPKRDAVSVVAELPTPKSTKSPLKLFGAYDTFTNGKLLRRLSQLEDADGIASKQADTPSNHRYGSSQDFTNESLQVPTEAEAIARSKLSNFGEHELDEYDFEANISFPSVGSQQGQDLSEDGSPEPDALPPGARSPFMFHLEESDEVQESFGIKRKLSDRSTAKSGRSNLPASIQGTPRKNPVNEEGKRLRESPIKAPTPKRQRTIHAMDLEMERLVLEDRYDLEQNMQDDNPIPSIEIYGDSPDASLHAVTQPRPRNPTPNQQRWSDSDEDEENEFLSSSPKMQAIREKIAESSLPGSVKLVSQTKAVANDLATFTLNVTRDNDAGERKRSITTQDFLDEAMHIMSLIRARGRPTSGLGSVEEDNEQSAIEQEEEVPQSVDQVSSILRVSRPPSREGTAPGWRPRFLPQQDSRVASQLRKFQEKDDIDIIETTIHSLKLRGLMEEEEYSELQDGSQAEIRIRGPLRQSEDGETENVRTTASDGSADYSTGHTQHSASSRKSDNVATLAPDAVAHLIPEQVAGMTFDRATNRWIKEKVPQQTRSEARLSPYPHSNLTSDDDPFGNIPDLTVDEIHEMEQVKSSQSSKQATAKIQPSRGHARFSSQDDTTIARPNTGNDKIHSALKSSGMRGLSMFDSSQHQVETRATSWSTEHGQKQQQVETLYEQSELSEPFELESTPSPRRPASRVADLREFSNETAAKWEQESDVEELPPRQAQSNRRVSFQAQTFRQRRFGPEVDQSELSMVAELPDKRLVSVSFAVSRPLAANHQHLTAPDHNDPSLILSDLPDFTVGDIDQQPGHTEQILSATVARHGLEVEDDRYALAVQQLVKTLTDVKGDEPFWEDIKHLSLSKQGLGTLHGLEEFCTRLQQLDISGNAVTQLDGAPLAIRWLNASHNALTSLTAWNRLVHLQYLDVSHNEITSLDGLGCLIHLRELKASHNQITSLDGLMDVEGLLKLDVAHNEIGTADFSHCQWHQLETLDISSNALCRMISVENLTALKRLSISDNKLSHMDLSASSSTPSTLRYLSASGNDLHALDLSHAASLRYLDLDDNSIISLPGLANLKTLDTLSLRRQSANAISIWNVVFSATIHARSVHMSGNILPSELDVFSTQNTPSYLELASCGLLSLPKDFGLHFPNLTHLNLNFNALKDVRPLLNIERLERLHLAGNRISRLRKCVETLAHLPGLKTVDLRDNPVNLGFYPALGTADQETQIVISIAPRDKITKLSTTLAEVQRAKEARYLLPDIAADKDAAHKKLMDEDTKIRRRVHEILIASSCRGLNNLDGVEMDRAMILKRDQAWDRLKELGILKPKGGV